MEKGELRQTDTWVATSIIFGGMTRMIQLRLDKVIEVPLTEYYSMLIESTLAGLQVQLKEKSSVAIAAVN